MLLPPSGEKNRSLQAKAKAEFKKGVEVEFKKLNLGVGIILRRDKKVTD